MMSNIVIPPPYMVSVRNYSSPHKMKLSINEDEPPPKIQFNNGNKRENQKLGIIGRSGCMRICKYRQNGKCA